MIIKLVVEIMSILGDDQTINVNGDANKTAGGSLFDYSNTYMVESVKHESAISNILMGLSQFTTDIEYEKPDTLEYTIEEKIDYNDLSKYQDFFDDYMENYNLVKNKITLYCLLAISNNASPMFLIGFLYYGYLENHCSLLFFLVCLYFPHILLFLFLLLKEMQQSRKLSITQKKNPFFYPIEVL